MNANRPRRKTQSAVLGVGLDATDGHKRLTRGKDFVLAGGSEETHAKMQETMIRVTEKLADRGKRIRDSGPDELRDLIGEAAGR